MIQSVLTANATRAVPIPRTKGSRPPLSAFPALSRRTILVAISGVVGLLPALLPSNVAGQEWDPVDAYPVEARIWLDRGVDPVLHRGDRTRIYYRVMDDAYVAIFHIDTDGHARIVHPRDPHEMYPTRGGRDYRLLFSQSPYWLVDDQAGVGYFFIVASPVPFDFSDFQPTGRDYGWDLTRVGGSVYRDPHVAMDDYIASLIPDWEYAEYAVDFSAYHIGQSYAFPRFLCYDCHGAQPLSSWNPYHHSCRSFTVVVYNDPYYYPSTRYRGDRVVYARPPSAGEPHFAFKERAAGEAGMSVVRARTAAERGVPSPRIPAERGNVQGGVNPGGTPAASPPRAASPSVQGDPRRPRPSVGPARSDTERMTAPPPRSLLRRPAEALPGRDDPGAARPALPERRTETTAPVTGTPRARTTPMLPPTPRARIGEAQEQASPPRPKVEERSRPVLERRPPPAAPPPRRDPPAAAVPPRRNGPPPAAVPPRRNGPPAAAVPPRRNDPPPAAAPPPRRDPPPAAVSPRRGGG